MTFVRSTLTAFALTAVLAAPARTQDVEEIYVSVPKSHFEDAGPIGFGAPSLYELVPDGPSESMSIGLAGGLEALLEGPVDAAGGTVESVGDELEVNGSEAALALVRDHAQKVARWVDGRCVLRIVVAHVADGADGADEGALRAALGRPGAEIVWSGRIDARRGEPTLREDVQERSLIAMIDAEVAVDAAIADPISMMLRTGLRVATYSRTIDDDRTLSVVSLQLSDLTDMRAVEAAAGTLELPRVAFLSITAPMILAKGAPQFITAPHPWKDGHVVVRVELEERPEHPDVPYRLIDLAAYSTASGLTGRAAYTGYDGYDEQPSWAAIAEAAEERLDKLGDNIVHQDMQVFDLTPSIYAIGPEVTPRLPELRASSVTVDRVVAMAADVTSRPEYDPLDGSLPPGALGDLHSPQRPLRRTHVPVLTGAETLVTHGVWQRVLSSFEVEIAQGAAMAYPVPASFVEGTTLRLTSVPSGVHVQWSEALVISNEPQAVVIRTDIGGTRKDETVDAFQRPVGRNHLDRVVYHRQAGSHLVSGPARRLVVRNLGKSAVLEAWTAE